MCNFSAKELAFSKKRSDVFLDPEGCFHLISGELIDNSSTEKSKKCIKYAGLTFFSTGKTEGGNRGLNVGGILEGPVAPAYTKILRCSHCLLC